MTKARSAMSEGRQYPEYVREQYNKMPYKQVGALRLTNSRDLLAVTVEPPQHGDRWGSWRYDAKLLTLEYDPEDKHWDYQIDLETCTTSAETLDWICQVASKNEGCVSRGDMDDLIQALRDLLDPQSTLCSGGAEKGPIDVAAILKR